MTGTHPPGIEYTPPRPATLTIAGREIAVEEWPIGGRVEENRGVEVCTETENELVIGPRPGETAKRALFAALAVLAILLPVGLQVIAEELPAWVFVLVAAGVFALASVAVRASLRQQTWLRFDRRAGRLVCEHRVGFSTKRVTQWDLPLEKIVAVQLLFNGSHSVTEPVGSGEHQSTRSRRFYGYELNLILDDPNRLRMPLHSFSDGQWVRETGNRIGTFLRVPVIDKLQHGT